MGQLVQLPNGESLKLPMNYELNVEWKIPDQTIVQLVLAIP